MPVNATTTWSTFNPYGIESRYGLDMACYFLSQAKPATVRICSSDPEVVKAVVRRLQHGVPAMLVETPELAEMLQKDFGFDAAAMHPDISVDAAIVPFSRHRYETPPIADAVVVVASNAVSYKSLIHPGRVEDSTRGVLKWLQQSHVVYGRVGLLTPDFILLWTLSLILKKVHSPSYFRLQQRALERVFARGPLWWLGYTVVIAGRSGVKIVS